FVDFAEGMLSLNEQFSLKVCSKFSWPFCHFVMGSIDMPLGKLVRVVIDVFFNYVQGNQLEGYKAHTPIQFFEASQYPKKVPRLMQSRDYFLPLPDQDD